MFKKYIQRKLEKYVRKYFRRHPDIKLVVVTGSVGKTSTKVAIATVLSSRYQVRLHEGNHNSEISAPLAILGIDFPDDIRSLGMWIKIFSEARRRIRQPSDVDVIVQELGSDRPGQIAHYAKYILPDIAVVTAVSPEHMEFFGTIETVAIEELTAANFSRQAIINRDDIDGEYARYITNGNISTYGTSGAAEYSFREDDFSVENGYSGTFIAPDWSEPVPAKVKLIGEQSLRVAVAAGAVAVKLGLTAEQVTVGMSRIKPVPGRMNPLRGLRNSIIIDDSYNSSPLAAKSALQTLYQLSAPQRIAVLGSMNELGLSSEVEHKALGEACNPSELAWVVTVGREANTYLAPIAKRRGCQVKTFDNAIDAGGFVNSVLEPGAVVLFKGSQGDIYLEEAVKIVLHSTDDIDNLVRQSPEWMDIKQDFFSKFS